MLWIWGSSMEIPIVEKITRVIENRSDAAYWREAENFVLLSHRAIFGDIEVSAGPDALWDMSSRTVVEVGVVYWRRRRRQNKICQITEPAGSTRTFYKSRRWPWVAYCNLNSFVLSSRIKRSIASDDRLIVCTQRRSCSCHRFLTPNSRYTNSRTRWRIILNRIVKLPICLLRDL